MQSFKKFAVLCALSALTASAPAMAADVTIATSGKSAAALRAEISTAAAKVCRDATRDAGAFAHVYGESACVQATIDAALTSPAAKAVFANESALKLSRN